MASEQAKKAYPDVPDVEFVGEGRRESQRAAYSQGRLDQAEEDIAEAGHWYLAHNAAAAIRKGVE